MKFQVIQYDQAWVVAMDPVMPISCRMEEPAIEVTDADLRNLDDPVEAERLALEALKYAPQDPNARLLLGIALRRHERHAEATKILVPLTQSHPHLHRAWSELGLAWFELGETHAAREALLKAVDLSPFLLEAWSVLGSLFVFPDPTDLDLEPETIAATAALGERRFGDAKRLLSIHLEAAPNDARALKLLAEVHIQEHNWPEARAALQNSLEQNSKYAAARFRLATMLFARTEVLEALPHIDQLIALCPADMLFRGMKAISLGRSGQFDAAIATYRSLLAGRTDCPGLWLEFAEMLRAANRHQESAQAFAMVADILPGYARAHWSLATVKSFRFSEAAIDSIKAQMARPDITWKNRAELLFALGKAFEDRGRYRELFENYEKSNALLRQGDEKFDAKSAVRRVAAAKQSFSRSFIRARSDGGCPVRDPIFIVGMPRAGSTLIEQILSSHSAIEGLGELRDLPEIVEREFGGKYPAGLKNFRPEQFDAMGDAYLASVASRRKKGLPHFTDKMPGNYYFVGLIHLILPNAKIVDARRHPLDCCWSCFKHYFPGGAPFTHTLNDVGRGYAWYVEIMAHFDEVLPGRVHRVIHEQLVKNPEHEMKRLLDYLELPFEEKCLQFHRSDRWVRTLSSEQVRSPISGSGIGQWRNYEPWLGPLKEELGYLVDIYPDVPHFYPRIRAKKRIPVTFPDEPKMQRVRFAA